MEQGLDICIMAVPERMGHVKQYMIPRLAKLSKNVLVFEDKDHRGAWWNCKRIYQYRKGEGIIKLVIQDDLFFRDDLEIHVRHLMAHLSEDLQAISLFTPPRGAFTQAHADGYNALESWKLVWPPMMLVNDHWCSGVIQASRFMNDKEQNSRHDDTKMQHYAHASGKAPVIVTMSLAQHDLKVPSAQGHPANLGALERKSFTYNLAIEPEYYKELKTRGEGKRQQPAPYSR